MKPTKDDIRLLPETNTYLTRKTINTLLRGGCRTVKQLLYAKADELLRIKGIGPRAVDAVAEWREAVLARNQTLYADTFRAVSNVLREHGSEVSDQQAVAVMRVIWEKISLASFDAARLHQMLIPPEIQS